MPRTPGSPAQENLIARLITEKRYNLDFAVGLSTRKLIDYLIRCPDIPGTVRPLTENQGAMVRRVAEELGRDADATVAAITAAPDRSAAIDALLADARTDRAQRNRADDIIRAAAAELPVNHGYVLADGTYARTYRGAAGDVRVKTLDIETGAWEYLARGLSAIGRPDTRPITVADAKLIASLSHTCGHCGRGIETAESIERGIGPVCAKKFG